MSRRLAQALVSEGLLKPWDIEEALQRQVLFGGSLGTNLLEGGVLKEDELNAVLGKAHKLPVAGKQEIDEIGAHIPRLFPQVFAESYRLVPFKLDGNSLGVLVDAPPDPGLLDRVRQRLKLEPVPTITTEVRLHYAMNQLYGSALLPRIKTLLSKLDGITVVTEPGKKTPEAGVLSWGVSGASVASTPVPRTKSGKLDLRELMSQLEFATDRDTIVDLLLRAVMGMFQFAALFLVQGRSINGFRGTDPDGAGRIAQISLPVELPSVFQTIYATKGHYLGPLPSNSANTKLLADMGREPPRAALVAPLVIGDRLAVILYADNGERGISPKRVAAVLLLTQRASLAFEQLIRKRKAAAHKIIEDQGEHDWEEDVPIEFDIVEEEPAEPAADMADSEFEVITEGPVATRPLGTPNLSASTDDGGDVTWEAVTFDDIDPSPDANRQAFEEGLEEHGAADGAELNSDYRPFSDVEEGADKSIDGWGDVLVETADALGVQEIKPPPKTGKPVTAPPTVTWAAVIREAMAAARLVPKPASAPIEVAGTMMDETEFLFDGLASSDVRLRRNAVEKLLKAGPAGDDGLVSRFPGQVDFDPFDPSSKVPPFGRCSGICELTLARGTTAAALVLPFLDHEDRLKRFFGVYYLLAVYYPPALEALARRLYDTEPRCRHLAADALRGYSQAPGYEQIVDGVRAQLKVPVLESRVSAVQLLGQLRDPAAVPELIPMVVAPEPELAQACASALAVICAQEFGNDVPRWSEWWQVNYKRPRPVWLIQGLRHANPEMRRIANYELQLLTGMTTQFNPDAPEEEREEKAQMWENWWAKTVQAQQAAAVSGAQAG